MADEHKKNTRLLTRREREAIGAFVEYRALTRLWHKRPGIEKAAEEYGIQPERMVTLANYVFAQPSVDGVNPSCEVCGEHYTSIEDPYGNNGVYELCPSCDSEYWELDVEDQCDYIYRLFPEDSW